MYVAGRGSLSPPATENDFLVKNSVFYCSLVSVFYCSLVFDMFFFSHFLFIIVVFGLAYAHHNKSLNLIIFFYNFDCLLMFENVFSSSVFSGFFFFVFFIIARAGSVYAHHIFFLTYIYFL